MATSPLIKTPQTDGGTLYTFSSAARDLSKSFNNDNLDLVFSKFVLLNLPDFDRLDPNTFSNYQNYMQFDAIDGAIWNGGLKSDPNINFTESFQNYALNLEEIILSDSSYDNSTNKTVSERIFFKWLKETGAIRFKKATNQQKNPSINRDLFVEEDEKLSGNEQYRRVVKYIGNIDIVNNVNKAGESYSELYINVPTEVGDTPTILFDSIADENYKPGIKIQGDNEFILGRNSNTIHPQGLDTFAFYDYDQALEGSGDAGYTDSIANWMDISTPPNDADVYFTEPFSFTEVTNRDIRKYPNDYDNPSGFTGVSYRRNSLDGISLNFNSNDYKQINDNIEISNIAGFNGTDISKKFEFNSVLIYYDLEDKSDDSKTVTNLYGLLILDNITPTTDGGYIQRLPKFKPNRITGQNGNSYGFKVNLRIDAASNTSGVDTIINDYNTFSMGLFTESVAQLQESVKIFQRQQIEISELRQKVQSLENLIPTSSSLLNLQEQINSIKKSLDNSSQSFADSSTILDLISKNSDEIQKLVSGEISETLQYNTNIIKQGTGIIVDKSIPNSVLLSLKNQQYNIMTLFNSDDEEITKDFPLNLDSNDLVLNTNLLPYTNMLRINTYNTAINDIIINIDDERNTWKEGQLIRIVFDENLNLSSYNIKIFTDSLNRLGNGVFNKLVANINSSELSNKPIIDIICTQDGILKFTYDIIK